MGEHLLNIREAAEYLGVGEKVVKELVDAGELPAYKIGGSFLRFKQSQLVIAKTAIYNRVSNNSEKPRQERPHRAEPDNERAEHLRDFLYFNDFYILSVVVIVIAVALMIAT